MAQAPYKFIDRRKTATYTPAGNTLYQASSTSNERKTYSDLSYDLHRTMSDVGRRVLATLGRKLFADYPALEGMVLEQANLAISSFLPQFAGTRRSWGKLARSWLVDEWLPICDLRGSPYDGQTYLDLHVISELRDGDMGTLLTETSQGYPAIQIIPGHRIRSPLGSQGLAVPVRYEADKLYVNGVLIEEGRSYPVEQPIEWEATLIDGVILGPQGQPIAYRIYDGSWSYTSWVDVSARNLFLNFTPKWTDQARGIPALASSAWHWQDIAESRALQLVGQKVEDAMWLIEHNETGDRNSAQALAAAAAFGSDNTVSTPAVVDVKGGMRYVRANSGWKVEAPKFDRPGNSTQQYQETVLRDAMAGLEWNYLFGVDPSKAGGASMRIVVDRINMMLRKRRRSPAKSFKRVIGYALSKAMKLRLLPWDDDWWKWTIQGPADMTADKKYDSDVSRQEVRMGVSTLSHEIAVRGGNYDHVRAQRLEEAHNILFDAQELASKHGMSIEACIPLVTDALEFSTLRMEEDTPDDAEKPTADKESEDAEK